MTPKQISLYRGDSIPPSTNKTSTRSRGQTFARYFCGNGLIAKFSDGGSSQLLDDMDLLNLVLAHVGYELQTAEQELSDHSPMISFSECFDSAFRFTNRKQKYLEPCDFYDASHFVWKLDVNLDVQLEPGRYAFKYRSDSVNCRKIVHEQLFSGYQLTSNGGAISHVAMPLMEAIAGVYADNDQREHYAEIIDVVKFITSHDVSRYGQKLVNHALELAAKNHE